MKKLKKISLTNLSQNEMKKRELNRISGGKPGECCICAHGTANYYANIKGGLYSDPMGGSYTYFRD